MHKFPPTLLGALLSATLTFSAAGPVAAQNATPPEKITDAAANSTAFEKVLVAPLRIHLLSAPETPALSTTLTDADIARIILKVNRVWSQAGLFFYVESIVREEPIALKKIREPGDLRWLLGLIPEPTYSQDAFNLYYIKDFDANGVFLGKAIFVKDSATLRAVEGGIDEPIPRVTSHELGHALSLPHRQDRTNLMASGTTGTLFNTDEIMRARQRAAEIGWIKSASELLQEAEALRSENKVEESRVLYIRLGAMPGEGELLARIRRLALE